MLFVSIQPFKYRAAQGQALMVSTACRQLHVLDPETFQLVSPLHLKVFDSPVMSCVSLLNGEFLAVITLLGKLTILKGATMKSMGAVVHHNKHAMMVASYEDGNTIWLASAGFDERVHVYRLAYDRLTQQLTRLADAPRKEIPLPTRPECILITRDQATGNIVLVLSRGGSNNLEYYRLRTSPTGKTDICRLGLQNPVPQSSVWILFSLSQFRLCPVDPGLLAIATSSTPNLKIIVVRMRIPPSPEGAGPSRVTLTTSNLARLTVQAPKSDDPLMPLQCTVPAPQTRYSKPQIAWRPDGCGVWVTGGDGVIRGVDVRNGKIVATLGEKEKGHQSGRKIRCIWAGMVKKGPGVAEEWLVSDGFDKRLFMWKKDPDETNIQ
ncbi:hypothetical protein KEM56_006983 [Ascosphaera pollenicola]|nr:hypothetical protein KEM56_006983 [Ascosphaera pollenicola]